MTRFSSPAEVIAWAESAAAVDYARHAVVHAACDGSAWQWCRNPYSTEGMRNDWQRGYDNAPAHIWELTRDYDTAFQRGAAYRRLEEAAHGPTAVPSVPALPCTENQTRQAG